MVTVRFFGPARTAFGAAEHQVEASSLQGVLEALAADGSEELRQVLRRSRLWVNGEPGQPGAALDDADEVAVVPPVSGGS